MCIHMADSWYCTAETNTTWYIGLFQFDLVAWLFGGVDSLLSRIVYTLVGLAGVWCITLLFRRADPIEGE